HVIFQAEDGIRNRNVTGVQTCALPILIIVLTFCSTSSTTLAGLQKVNFAPASVVEEVLQNVSTIISTTRFTVPMKRNFGVDYGLIDSPLPVAQAQASAQIIAEIHAREPRARVLEVTYSGDAAEGILVPHVKVDVIDEYLPVLPDVEFAARDSQTVIDNVIGGYEELTGRKLAESDPVRLFLLSICYVIIQERAKVDAAGKSNLLYYA